MEDGGVFVRGVDAGEPAGLVRELSGTHLRVLGAEDIEFDVVAGEVAAGVPLHTLAHIQLDLAVIAADIPALGQDRLRNGAGVVVGQLLEHQRRVLVVVAREEVAFERGWIADDRGAQRPAVRGVPGAGAAAAVGTAVGACAAAAGAGAVVAAAGGCTGATVATGAGAADGAGRHAAATTAAGTGDRQRQRPASAQHGLECHRAWHSRRVVLATNHDANLPWCFETGLGPAGGWANQWQLQNVAQHLVNHAEPLDPREIVDALNDGVDDVVVGHPPGSTQEHRLPQPLAVPHDGVMTNR